MKTLGLDIGTNSIGWGIIDEANKKIDDCGVYIFPEGVKIEKGNESSKAAERTSFRAARRLKFRRKLRKYETLKVLIENEMCPLLLEELEKWRKQKIYPTSKEFVNWYRTDENNNWEPYYLRKKCVEQKAQKYEIGRALYHIAQRRGFLSNRKETTQDSTGTVKKYINELSEKIGKKTLGQYFYELKKSGEKVRNRYTSRKEHYEKEFYKICEVQGIDEELKEKLYNAIFFQRKLKSQKFLVGKCTLETDKPRCPISHFEFEEFRMLSFINNIKVARNSNEGENKNMEFLTKKEKESIIPLFFRISKRNFDFKDISKKLKGKNEDWKFNYRDDTNVAACPVSAYFKEIFGENWKEIKIEKYDINDIWHVLFDFDDDQKLKDFALNNLHLDEEKTKKFCDIRIPQGYANLSLKAIRKILPFLQKSYIYSKAVFLANIPTMIGKDVFEKHSKEIEDSVENIMQTLREKNNIIALTNSCIEAIFYDKSHNFHLEDWNKIIIDKQISELFGKHKWENAHSLEEQNAIKNEVTEKIENVLKIATTNNPNDYKYKPLRTDDLIMDYLNSKGFIIKKNAKLYHPSDSDYSFENPIICDDGKTYLGSPRTPSVKNPVAMRAMFQLRKLINYLIKIGEIDSSTRIHIELANEVNDKNKRKAIQEFQKEQENKNKEAEKRLIELCSECGIKITPTESDIKKYRLWQEQKEQCPYTGKAIRITELFGPNPKFDFEHTIPRSLSYDDSIENLTLCDSDFNRNVKKQHIPSELANFDEINTRFQKFYEDKIDNCLTIIEKNKTSSGYVDPNIKDMRIVKRLKAKMELDYYIRKLKRFTAKEINSSFTHRQLNDTRLITKFALQYLKSVFPKTFPVKGSMTDTFKRQWGLLDRNENKDRSNYRHHIVDALTIACIDRRKFNLLSQAIRESSDGKHLKFEKPWNSFDTDVLNAVKYVIPKNFVDDNSLRQSKKISRDRFGKPILKDGRKIYITGDTVRGSLHKDTFYGCIQTPPEKEKTSEQIFVQRVTVSSIENKEFAEKIIDKGIQDVFKKNLETGKQSLSDIQSKGILLPYKINGKDIYVKKIRIKAKPTNPIVLKKHNNVIEKNPKDYKQNYYVVNDENYLVALYRGTDKNGKPISDKIILNLLEASKHKKNNESFYPNTVKKGEDILSLYKVLKIGKIVILQETPDENILAENSEKIWKRMYRISGLANSGNRIHVKLTHIISSNPWTYLKGDHDLDEGIEFRRYQVNNFVGLIEGEDFTISPTGKLEPIKK